MRFPLLNNIIWLKKSYLTLKQHCLLFRILLEKYFSVEKKLYQIKISFILLL